MKYWTKQAILNAKAQEQEEGSIVNESQYFIDPARLLPSLRNLVVVLSFDAETNEYLVQNPPMGVTYSSIQKECKILLPSYVVVIYQLSRYLYSHVDAIGLLNVGKMVTLMIK
jgi:hypothetical protein